MGRVAIPRRIELAIKVLGGFQCCICGQCAVQIHHIDGDHNNHALNNLALLCLNHHDQAEQGKSTDGHRLTLKLDSGTIRSAKKRLEENQARRLGYKSSKEFLRTKSTIPPSRAKPKHLAVAFTTWDDFVRLRDTVAGIFQEGMSKHFSFRIQRIRDQLWVTLFPARPDFQLNPPGGWISKGENLVIPFQETDVYGCFADLTEFEQDRLERIAYSQLERMRSLASVGLVLDCTVNGPQRWPEGRRDLELGIWLQYAATLRSYFSLLGEFATTWRETALETARLRACNVPMDNWTVSPWDGLISERVDSLVTVFRGKSRAIAENLHVPVRMHCSQEYDTLVENIVDPTKRISKWPGLVTATKEAMAAVATEADLKESLRLPNSVMTTTSVTMFEHGKFDARLQLFRTELTGSIYDGIEPGAIPNMSNVSFDVQNYCEISLKPRQLPSSVLKVYEEWCKISVQELFRVIRKKRISETDISL